MPRSRSIAIQSERARRCSPRARTAPAIWMAPPNGSSFSVSVVLPASGCEMMAKVRRSSIASVKVLIGTRSEEIVPEIGRLPLDDDGLPFGRRLAGRGIVLQALAFRARIDDVAGRSLILPEHQAVDEMIVGLDHLGGLLVDGAADVLRRLVATGLGQQELLALGAVRRGGRRGLAGSQGGTGLVGRGAFLRTRGARRRRQRRARDHGEFVGRSLVVAQRATGVGAGGQANGGEHERDGDGTGLGGARSDHGVFLCERGRSNKESKTIQAAPTQMAESATLNTAGKASEPAWA